MVAREVLEALQITRQQIGAASARSREALEIMAQCFGLSVNSPVISAILDFATRWENKKTTKTVEISEFLDYFEYFREARGTICLPPNENEDAVRLMTVHSAKGLEFRHVFIIRAISGSFPCSYKEPLVEFPRDLRRADSAADEEGKTLHEEEERRLFYVAMTRARDTLTLYAKQGRGKKIPARRDTSGNFCKTRRSDNGSVSGPPAPFKPICLPGARCHNREPHNGFLYHLKTI